MRRLRQSISDLIAGLSSLCTCQLANSQACAVSLLGGTLLLPLDESHASRVEGWLAVSWQGDFYRRSEVVGTQLAQRTACRHVELHGVGQSPAQQASLPQSLTEPFRHAAGLSPVPETIRVFASYAVSEPVGYGCTEERAMHRRALPCFIFVASASQRFT